MANALNSEWAPKSVPRKSTIRFSIVINTDNRIRFLPRTIQSLLYQDYRDFEICIVAGPTPDGTREYADSLGDRVKVGHCPIRNLSVSRNIGIAMAAGDVVIFIDDDAVPEPEWLSQLAQSYADPSTGAAGGKVYDHTGTSFQAEFVTVNRLGYARNWDEAAPHLNFPLSHEVPHLLGTNCSFRRDVLHEIGGFDEEYEYFLDETDVCIRVNDAGYKIAQRGDAFVHHKYAPSSMRDERKIVRNWYPLIKNRIYFGLRHATLHYGSEEAVAAGLADVRAWEGGIAWGLNAGDYTKEDERKFYEEMEQAFADAQARAAEPPKYLTEETKARFASSFRPFPILVPEGGRRVICLLTQDYPPGQNGGIARIFQQKATTLAAQGHHVHVFTKAKENSTVDFEDGVWVHRVRIHGRDDVPSETPISPLHIPNHIWSYSATMLDEVRRVDARQGVDLVYVPMWDCEPIAFLMDGKLPVMVALQTSMKYWLQSQPLRAADEEWMGMYGRPILAMEDYILKSAPIFHANSEAIVKDIARGYDLKFAKSRLLHAYHGLDDWSRGVTAPKRARGAPLSILFVGRLESRKGIDALLKAAPAIVRDHPNVVFDIVGDDTIPKPDGSTYKQEFLAANPDDDVRERVRFHGRVEEDDLRTFYAACDIFVAPSKYESFGLIYLEAMMFSKPLIAGRAGGGGEIIEEGKTGLLVDPGDAEGLKQKLESLIEDAELRQRLGRNARQAYEERFTAEAMMRPFMERLAGRESKKSRNLDEPSPANRDN